MLPSQYRNVASSPRILVLTPVFGKTSEVWLYRQCCAFDNCLLSVIAYEHHNKDIYSPEEFELILVPPALSPPRSRWSRHVNPILNRRHNRFGGSRTEIAWWDRTLDQLSPDVALCHFGSTATYLAPILLKRRLPLVVHFNGFDLASNLRLRGYRRAIAKLAPSIDACVVVAPYMADRLRSLGVSDERIHLIPYGVPIPKRLVGRDRSANCVFLSVGRFTEKKSPISTLKAFESCLRSVPDARLRMIGDGPLMQDCIDYISEVGLGKSVSFIGAVPGSVVTDEMQSADVFVQHSVTAGNGDMEGWPVSIAEACANGLPVVATRHAGITMQIEDGVSGFLVREYDIDSMATHMKTLAKSSTLRKQMGQAAFLRIREFDSSIQANKLRSVLDSVLASS